MVDLIYVKNVPRKKKARVGNGKNKSADALS